MIQFNIPPYVGSEPDYIKDAIESGKICGDGKYTKLCNTWLEERLNTHKALLTTSCTHATELAVLLSDIHAEDEVIVPSFTFVSTADAVVLRGATPVFVDIRPDTMNIDESLIEAAVTDKTKAIIPVHYAGVSCEMNVIMDIAKKYGLKVIEDAAQAIGSTYDGKACGTIGEYGCLSFHETKNISMGEGGALLIRDRENVERAEIMREKGTNRSQFYRGEVDKYTWMDAGSSYLPSELNAAYLYAQLEAFEKIQASRIKAWEMYYEVLKPLEAEGHINLPFIPDRCVHNAHMFYIKVRDIDERTDVIGYLKEHGIYSVFHYVPLHSSPAGKRFGRFAGEDKYTTVESERLLRLPLHYGIKEDEVSKVCTALKDYYINNAGGAK
ncbi:MAG: dTDP-4-amino-4,6-dideoxygalactose transaminase [Lachnospiraceae bacterium]|nr:dTDP-4-amino-4,6-dideoxygalactose transaminase [Lachnospiraceae bacterium]